MFHKYLVLVPLTVLTLGGQVAKAELDPELAQATSKNNNGLYLGLGARGGQAYGTGGSTPGLAAFATVEPGYVARRDSWGRVETSLELGTGALSFRRKNDAKTKVGMAVPVYALARVGYGWSLGDSLFSVIRLGAGPAFANYKEEENGESIESDGMVSGIAGQIAWDLIAPMGSSFDIIGGLALTHMAFDINDLEKDGQSISVDRPVAVNMPTAYFGVRLQF